MSIEYIGEYRTKAPKIRHSSKNPFDFFLSGDKDGKKLAEYFGLEINNYASNMWLYVAKYVKPHTDGGGSCLVYLHRGRGKLYVLKNGKLCEQQLHAGDVVMFNDRCKHFWFSDTPCTLLCCNVHRKNS